MRMMVESDLRPDGGVIGAGIEELQWPRAVRPGDVLRIELEVLEITPSRSKPQQGIVRVAMNTFNQNDEPVMHAVGRLLMFRRPPG
jgi:acyl dehydratase